MLPVSFDAIHLDHHILVKNCNGKKICLCRVLGFVFFLHIFRVSSIVSIEETKFLLIPNCNHCNYTAFIAYSEECLQIVISNKKPRHQWSEYYCSEKNRLLMNNWPKKFCICISTIFRSIMIVAVPNASRVSTATSARNTKPRNDMRGNIGQNQSGLRNLLKTCWLEKIRLRLLAWIVIVNLVCQVIFAKLASS